MSANGMIPGQEPYTPEQLKRLHQALEEACEAEEQIPYEELEEATNERRFPHRGRTLRP